MPNAPYTNLTQLSRGGDGTVLGQSATDPVALYGHAPVAQRASAFQAASVERQRTSLGR